ncbi:MAG TPA: hypothetical protein V6C81_09155 [Planktothrix sp.]|jgi:hypothetical protein
MNKIVASLASIFVLCGVAPNSVIAADSSVLPPVVDEYRILSDNWNIQHKETGPVEESYTLTCSHAGKTYHWPIDFQFQYSTLHKDDNGTGNVNEAVVNHLLEAEQTNTFGPLVVKVASYKHGGDLFVRDLNIFNAYDAWKKACQYGSPMLGMDSGGIKRIGLDKYKKKCEVVSDKDWQALAGR